MCALLNLQADLLQRDSMCRRCVHLAAQAGQVSMLQQLVTRHGASVNDQVPSSGVTPLHLACKVTTVFSCLFYQQHYSKGLDPLEM